MPLEMQSAVVSEGPSADSALTFDDEPADFNPSESCGTDNSRLAEVWARSDALRKLLTERVPPGNAERRVLNLALKAQLPTLYLYVEMAAFMAQLKNNVASSSSISLYVVFFPGEARDNTGVKDLNENVIGQWWNAQYQQKRFDAIETIFGVDGFVVAAQTYKTAYIITYDQKREAFRLKLALLDEALRKALIEILEKAAADTTTTDPQQKEIKKLRDKLKKEGYRFDIFFGLRSLEPKIDSILTNVYLLVTEAMKGAALARFVAKGETLGTRAVKQVAAKPGISPDGRKLDARGKEYVWLDYMRVSDLAEEIKKMILKGALPSMALELNQIYVDSVWTLCYVEYKNLFWGNADVIRDVRKKKLVAAPRDNVSAAYPVQKDLLELWLVILNMVDFVKRFKSEEFDNKLKIYHDRAQKAYIELNNPSAKITADIWDNIQFVLTHDIRQADPIAVIDTSSEYQYYSAVSDYGQRIFFSMDVRDMGVELMLSHERTNREIGFQKYSDLDLMKATFRSDDPIDTRRRFTYDTVVAVMRKYYDQLTRSPGGALTAAQLAFAGAVSGKLGSFAESVQVMLGGDEVYVATHPLFAQLVPKIVGELTRAPYVQGRTLDMRASVAFSAAKKTDPANQRQATQRSHQEALKLTEVATGKLKFLERANRRIERLIDMIEANPKKQPRGAGYRQDLAKLPLTTVFARLKHNWPEQLSQQTFARLYAALKSEDPAAAPPYTGLFELVDFTGQVIPADQLAASAQALEDKVRQDVGQDNVRVQAPPLVRLPKWIQAIIDGLLKDKDPKKAK